MKISAQAFPGWPLSEMTCFAQFPDLFYILIYINNEVWPPLNFHFVLHATSFPLERISWQIMSYNIWGSTVYGRIPVEKLLLNCKVPQNDSISHEGMLRVPYSWSGKWSANLYISLTRVYIPKNHVQFQFSPFFTPLISCTEIRVMLQSEIIRPGNYTLLRD